MSTTHGCLYGICFNGSKAVDGVYGPGPGLLDKAIVTSTVIEYNPWLQIKLNQSYNILAVKAWKAVIAEDAGIIVISLKLKACKKHLLKF